MAVIQGRHCLAYRGLMCSTCHERCPVEGAIVLGKGIPRVVSDLCTGCGDCRALQVRYRHDGALWWDTLMTQPDGTRVVRIRREPDGPA